MGLMDRDWFREESRKRDGLPPTNTPRPSVKRKAASPEDLAKARNVPPADVVAAARNELAKRGKTKKNVALGVICGLAAIAIAMGILY